MRLLSRPARLKKRLQVVGLRQAGGSYLAIAAQTGLSRTGVFDICKRHSRLGLAGMTDPPAGRVLGIGRSLTPIQETLVRQLIAERAPDQLGFPSLLWSHKFVALLLTQRLHLTLPIRTLDGYLERWGYVRCWPGLASTQRRLALQRPDLAIRTKNEDAAVLWGHCQALLGTDWNESQAKFAMLSTRNAKGEVRWLTVAAPPVTAAVIDFMRRLICTFKGRKVLLLMRPSAVFADPCMKEWLAEKIDSIELIMLPS